MLSIDAIEVSTVVVRESTEEDGEDGSIACVAVICVGAVFTGAHLWPGGKFGSIEVSPADGPA